MTIKVIIGLVVSVLIFISGMFAENIRALLIKSIYSEEYANLVFKCDGAMRQHYISKQRVFIDPNIENVNSLQQAEIGLIDCQDYDILRKRLQNLGLRNSDLSELELNAIERKSNDIRKVVDIHEIHFD